MSRKSREGVTRRPPSPPAEAELTAEAAVRGGAPRRNGGWGLTRYILASSLDRSNQAARDAAVANLFPEGSELTPFLRRFTALMMLSTLIAVLGLLADSTAVVIGAMLVAPLMSPILGLAVAVVMGWPGRALRQTMIAIVGAVGSVFLATVTSFAFPGTPNPLPSELMARTSPNLLDLGVALVAGAAGAYASSRRQAADAISGVAVAVALVPPLAVVGICLQLTEWKLALGAFMLFLANVVGIVLAASVTFVACGLVPAARLGKHMVAPGLRLAVLAVLLMVFPLHLSRRQVLPPIGEVSDVTLAVERLFDEDGNLSDLVDSNASIEDDVATVHLMVAAESVLPPVEEIAGELADELGLEVQVNVHVLAGTAATSVAEP